MHILINKKYLIYKDYKAKCAIGKRGIGYKKKEGDLITPIGFFKIKYILYRKDRIKKLKTKLKKIIINKKMGWCNDPYSKHYNKLIKLPEFSNKKHGKGWHLFQLNIDFKKLKIKKQDFMQYLRKHSIGSQVHYIPLVNQPYYSNNYEKKYLLGAQNFYKNTISIPMYTSLNAKDIKFISRVINNYFNKIKP